MNIYSKINIIQLQHRKNTYGLNKSLRNFLRCHFNFLARKKKIKKYNFIEFKKELLV